MNTIDVKLLSIIIPCFNEKENILKILDKIESVKLIKSINKEIIIIDDFSTDGTRDILKNLDGNKYKIILLPANHGKGYAVRQGIEKASGDIVIIQDADLEYDPEDYNPLLKKIISDNLPVIYGSRRMNKKNEQYSGWIYYIGGNITTILINILYGTKLTDGNTCYKMFRKDSISGMQFVSNKFDFDQEITSKFLKRFGKIVEIPINYYPRKNIEGKKINVYDFFHAIDVILKFKFNFKKESWTTFKLLSIGLGSLGLFFVVITLLNLIGFYSNHNYYSIGLAFFVADFFAYGSIKFVLFGDKKLSISDLIKKYLIHISSLMLFYFGGVYYFVKIAQGEGFYQGLFFMVMSILFVSGTTFIQNLIKGLTELD